MTSLVLKAQSPFEIFSRRRGNTITSSYELNKYK